ncbi:MAG TPA: Wadjet anti-phage system protein JetD domain-containing protein [Clostridium sp.]|uniref:Wadjet anti-phage system protein JetD domain-containing protein n=1 Tax=Clostridium sp. TaxID=1506 RepID=UPI002F93D799
MKNYSNIILNTLLDKYEKSSLYKGNNVVTVNIGFKVTSSSLPDYFNEINSDLKDEINECCLNLCNKGFVEIHWKRYEEGNIIEKVTLNVLKLEEIYKTLKRTQKQSMEAAAITILEPYLSEQNYLSDFSKDITQRLQEKKSIKKYFDIEDLVVMSDVLKAIHLIIRQDVEIPKRVFSVYHFNDSKRLEKIESKLIRIMIDFGGFDSELDVLAEANIIKNPSYVYLKGSGIFTINDQKIDLQKLQGEIGLSISLIEKLVVNKLDVSRILTIENLTTFHSYKSRNELVIYLGGYHNSIRRELLVKLYEFNIETPFYHWGDIDLGGFRILNHLKKMTGIPFKAYLMDGETLVKYKDHLKLIDKESYLDSLRGMLQDSDYEEHFEAIKYMIENRVRLEQEVVDIV